MLIAFNKPYGVICQFSPSADKPTLKDYVAVPNVYPAGRLDTDSEGLLLLTDDGVLQARITDPNRNHPKTYWVQVDGQIDERAAAAMRESLDLGDFATQPAVATLIDEPTLWPRVPPVRFRQSIPTSWCEITLTEGKNRQIRRMTAKVGFPTLRLVRVKIGDCDLRQLGIAPGSWCEIEPQAVLGDRRPRR
jgi:23S rRNA pseudouridine2457 synthase